MRFIYGMIAVCLWMLVGESLLEHANYDTFVLTCAIVAAGAMAGGA